MSCRDYMHAVNKLNCGYVYPDSCYRYEANSILFSATDRVIVAWSHNNA